MTRAASFSSALPQQATAEVSLQAISQAEPCGPSLEYDAEYAVLFARMAPRAEAQYGRFLDTPEAPNWAEIERDCRRLLLRTRDINILVWLCRARARLGQATGLAGALSNLCAVLQAWPAEVHPQLVMEGESEPAVRANALAALADPEGLLADVRDIVIAANTAMRLTVRDVERAFTVTVARAPEWPSAEAVGQQLAALHLAAASDAQAAVHGLAQAATHVREIEAWTLDKLGDHAPSLKALSRLLTPFEVAPAPPLQEETSMALSIDPLDSLDLEPAPRQAVLTVSPSAAPPLPPSSSRQTGSRDEVLRSICAAREWFETHEPSSPVAVLLKQAERMVGKRFYEVADAIPLDLLQKWQALEDGTGAAL